MPRSDAAAASPYLLVVGCPRSGTTLLQRMLDAHPDLAVANDTHFIARTLQSTGSGSAAAGRDPARAGEMIAWARAYHRFPRLGLAADAVERAAQEASTFGGFVGSLYRELARSRGKRHGAEKTPDYVRSLPALHALLPGVRSLHILRDGRDVALSALGWAHETKGPGRYALWREEPVAVCALWWRWQVGSGLASEGTLPSGSHRRLHYEELVEDPEPVLREVCEFLELPYSPSMPAFHRGRERRAESLSAKKAWRPATAGLRDWRRQMDPRSVELFEELAGDLLERCGYPLASRERSAEVVRTARRCRARWREETAGRGAIRAGLPSVARGAGSC